MKVLIRRDSKSYDQHDEKPLPGASWEKFEWTDERTFSSPDVYDHSQFGKPDKQWNTIGKNHRLTKAGIARDIEGAAWFVEVPDVFEFVNKHGFSSLDLEDGVYVLTIRDRDD